MVEFIKYDAYPHSFCNGKLTLRIDGKEYIFSGFEENKRFWESGGRCGFMNGYSDAYIEKEPWIIIKDDLPDELKQYSDEIEKVFNKNVPYGCCGGCL